MERMTINKNNTYLGAFDVIEKILFGSKYLYISDYIYYEKTAWSRMPEGDNNEG